MKKLFKIEEHDAYIKAGVVSFETARDISCYYPYRAMLSYYYREKLKDDIPDKYKKYKNWYAHEIRDVLSEDVCDLILEEVWGLHEMSCVNKEFECVYAAPTLQDVINWLIEDMGVILTVAFLNKTRKWVYRTQSILYEHMQLTDNIEIYTSSKQFSTWQEALDTGIRDIIVNANADCIMKSK